MRFLVLIISSLLTSSYFGQESRLISHQGVVYQTFTTPSSKVHLHWKNAAEKKYKTFSALRANLSQQGHNPLMITNAGIYEKGEKPCGLHIENGKTLLPLNLKNQAGNFYLKPNGVFLIQGKKAQILESSYYAKENLTPELAVQSGPLLIQHGKIHPKFNQNSKSKLLRSGVGVNKDGDVVFAITAKGEKVNLHGFACLFLHLDCENALFLDGVISQMEIDTPTKVPVDYAALFAIY